MSANLIPKGNFPKRFDPDSRAAWLETQVLHGNSSQILFPKEINPYGPGRYNPMYADRPNIGTPNLGSSISTNNPFLKSESQSQYNIVDSMPRPGCETTDYQEFATPFHDHDRKMAIDPKLRYCKTPGTKLGQMPMLEHLTFDGLRRPQSSSFSPTLTPFGNRLKTIPALPDYDIHFDSEVLRPRTSSLATSNTSRFPHYEKKKKKQFKSKTNQLNSTSVTSSEPSKGSFSHSLSRSSSFETPTDDASACSCHREHRHERDHENDEKKSQLIEEASLTHNRSLFHNSSIPALPPPSSTSSSPVRSSPQSNSHTLSSSHTQSLLRFGRPPPPMDNTQRSVISDWRNVKSKPSGPTLIFDTSSYSKKPLVVDVHPVALTKFTKSRVFSNIESIPREHKSVLISSQISDKIKRTWKTEELSPINQN